MVNTAAASTLPGRRGQEAGRLVTAQNRVRPHDRCSDDVAHWCTLPGRTAGEGKCGSKHDRDGYAHADADAGGVVSGHLSITFRSKTVNAAWQSSHGVKLPLQCSMIG